MLENFVEYRDENLMQSCPSNLLGMVPGACCPLNRDHAVLRVLVAITSKCAKASAVCGVGDPVLKLPLVPALFRGRALGRVADLRTTLDENTHIARSQWEERTVHQHFFFMHFQEQLCAVFFLKPSCFFWYFSVKTCSMFLDIVYSMISLHMWYYINTQIN